MEMDNTPEHEHHIQEEYVSLYYASIGNRFVNWLIDLLIYYLLVFIAFFIIGIILVSSSPATYEWIISEEFSAKLAQVLISIIVYLLYYVTLEGATKGLTIGKLVTRNRAVREDGTHITWGIAFKRSLCRIIPFEVFSALGGTPWHDSITKTTVIKR
ncbi:MAG: RDD family protein [Bacteroidetes bacterium]|nr:RDD family protein [Bacteroidota bacterium]